MTAPIVQADYEQLEQIRSQFEDQAELIERLNRTVADHLQNSRANWEGDHADQFFARLDNEVVPGLGRLLRAMRESGVVTQQIIQIMRAAEEEAANIWQYDGGGSSGGTPGTGGPGGSPNSSIPPAPPGIPRDRWNELMGSGFYFKLAGDAFGSVNWVKALAAVGIVIPEPATSGGGLAVLGGMTAIAAGLKYGEKFGEEPNLVRGGSIATIDAVFGSAIDLTGVGTVVQMGNSIHQLYGGLEVAQSRLLAETGNVSPELHNSLFESTEAYYNTMAKTDLTNIRYEVARFGYDVYNAPRQGIINQLHDWGVPGAEFIGSATGAPAGQDVDLGQSFGRVVNATTDVFVGAWDYGEAWTDMKINQGVTVVNTTINNSPLPDSFKETITSAGDDFAGYMADNSRWEIMADAMPWNW